MYFVHIIYHLPGPPYFPINPNLWSFSLKIKTKAKNIKNNAQKEWAYVIYIYNMFYMLYKYIYPLHYTDFVCDIYENTMLLCVEVWGQLIGADLFFHHVGSRDGNQLSKLGNISIQTQTPLPQPPILLILLSLVIKFLRLSTKSRHLGCGSFMTKTETINKVPWGHSKQQVAELEFSFQSLR